MDKTIIICDDKSPKTAAFLIEHNLNCVCVPYVDARECWADLEGGLKFDLLFTDLATGDEIRHPNLFTGFDLGERVRQIYLKIPIITISAYDCHPNFSNCHLVRPIRSKDYIKVIKDFLG